MKVEELDEVNNKQLPQKYNESDVSPLVLHRISDNACVAEERQDHSLWNDVW